MERLKYEGSPRLAICVSHPIQYYSPLFRELAGRVDLEVFYAHRPTGTDQARAGFGVGFEWDLDLLSDYSHVFLENRASDPGLHHFGGCDTPRVGRHLAEGSFEAVLVMGWHLKSYVQAIWAAKRLGLPVMVRGDSQLGTARSLAKRAVKHLLYPPLLRRFDAALYVGTRSRAYYEHYGYPTSRLFHSPHCVDNDWFAERATPEARGELRARLDIGDNTALVLFAGKLVPFKRPLDVVEACTRLRDQGKDVQLLIAGAGELEEQIRANAHQTGLPLHLLGFCNQTEMPAAYAAADVLVLPSSAYETWGLVANEALACGTPIVVSDACGCAQDLANSDNAGRSFPVGDIDALAQALAQVLHHPPDASSIRDLAETHSIPKAVDGIVTALHAVSAARHGQSAIGGTRA